MLLHHEIPLPPGRLGCKALDKKYALNFGSLRGRFFIQTELGLATVGGRFVDLLLLK
jgi:hypothetical protein